MRVFGRSYRRSDFGRNRLLPGPIPSTPATDNDQSSGRFRYTSRTWLTAQLGGSNNELLSPIDAETGVMISNNNPDISASLSGCRPESDRSQRRSIFADVRFGALRTQVGRRERSEMCQFRTHAPQQAIPYSITSSARASNVEGTSKPSAIAVIRLTTSSNLIGCSTGRSAGFVPRRILST
jgi:hypothetical protein